MLAPVAGTGGDEGRAFEGTSAKRERGAGARAEKRAGARRVAGDAQPAQKESDGAPRAKPEPRDRDPLVEALDKRLAAVDPAIVDFDDLGLRETVLRICADLGVEPDWSRWEAGDWKTPDTPPNTAPQVQVSPPRAVTPPPGVLLPFILPGLPRPAPRAARWRPPQLE